MSLSTDSRKRSSSTKPTIAELATRLSLSKGTVSRILNDKGSNFSKETRHRVFTVAQEIGYAPDPLAHALATGRSGFVSLWVQTLVTSYHAQVAHAMEKALNTHDYHILVTPFGRFSRNGEEYAKVPIGVDGMIAHEIYSDLWLLLFGNAPRNFPVVTTGMFMPLNSRDHVLVDIAGATTEAIRHLVASQRRRVAYVSDSLVSRHHDTRYIAYRTVLAESGLKPELISLPSADRAAIRSASREYVQTHGCPGALFCHNDDVAVAAYRALLDLGLQVPADCALVGCDGIPDTEYLPVPITTIVQPYAAVCDMAYQFLKQRMAAPEALPQHVTLPAVLEIRQSSMC